MKGPLVTLPPGKLVALPALVLSLGTGTAVAQRPITPQPKRGGPLGAQGFRRDRVVAPPDAEATKSRTERPLGDTRAQRHARVWSVPGALVCVRGGCR